MRRVSFRRRKEIHLELVAQLFGRKLFHSPDRTTARNVGENIDAAEMPHRCVHCTGALFSVGDIERECKRPIAIRLSYVNKSIHTPCRQHHALPTRQNRFGKRLSKA